MAIINVHNQDDRCFTFAVLSALHSQTLTKHPYLRLHYMHLFQLFGLDNIPSPVALEGIPAIEDNLRVSINVFSVYDDQGKAVNPLCLVEPSHVDDKSPLQGRQLFLAQELPAIQGTSLDHSHYPLVPQLYEPLRHRRSAQDKSPLVTWCGGDGSGSSLSRRTRKSEIRA